MCDVCGCSHGQVRIEGHVHDPDHNDAHHDHHHDKDILHFGQGSAHAHAPGLSQARMVQIEQDILGKNKQYAERNRQLFAELNCLVINLVSSPGSGKTSLLVRTITDLCNELSLAVIEGDQQTTHDAERIRDTGVPALQINTGKGCHLDAHMVGHALEHLDLPRDSVLAIENVGNLVCPAAFDLGEYAKVAILSVTEGEDKPLKYSDMFAAAKLMLLNKIDLLPYVDFDIERCIEYARRVNPELEVIGLSARTGQGLEPWYDWLRVHRDPVPISAPPRSAKQRVTV